MSAPIDPRIGQQTASNGATIITSFTSDGTIVTNGPITAQTNPNPNIRVGYGIGKQVADGPGSVIINHF